MNRKWLFSTVVVMGMSLMGCSGNGGNCDDEYTAQLEDSIARLHSQLSEVCKQLDDCQNSKKTKNTKSKKSKSNKSKKSVTSKIVSNDENTVARPQQDVTINGNGNCVHQNHNVVNISGNGNNNTVIINNGNISTASSSSSTLVDSIRKQGPKCTVTGDIKVTVTRRTIIERNVRSR